MIIALDNVNNNINVFVGTFRQRVSMRYFVDMDMSNYEAHSALEKDLWEKVMPSDTTNTALHFAEGIPGVTTGYTIHKDDTFHMSHNDEIGLHDMLSRPQKVFSADWEIGSSISVPGGVIPVVDFLLRNKRVANRINNFSYMNATVNIRAVISGVPQHYGLAVVALNPWHNKDYVDYFLSGNAGPTYNQMVQLPHVLVDPSTSTGGEISLPLILPTNALNLQDSDSVYGCMGLHFVALTTLQTVSSDDTPAKVSIWAWLSDVVLTNPTSINLPYLTAQSGDEYGKPTISKYASTYSKWSEYFNNIPVIGSYARASGMLVGGIGKIAELFGYSRPNGLRLEMPMQHKPLGNLVHYNCEDTTTKLTLDAKAEVTIDPTIAGLKLGDEMAFANVVIREGLLGSFNWASTNVAGDILMRLCVTPAASRRITTTGTNSVPNVIDMSPLTFCSNAFSRWRGTVRLRFLVVCSHFHKGRIRFVYEPGATLTTVAGASWANETNINQSYILDLASSKEITIEVPWASVLSYLKVSPQGSVEPNYFDFTADQSVILHTDRDSFNGLLGAHVLMPLVSPSASDNVKIMVFISGAPDIEFQEPSNGFANYMFAGWAPQSGQEIDLKADVLTGNELATQEIRNVVDILGTKSKSLSDKIAEIHYGERIVSMRQLIKRYVHHQYFKINSNTGISYQRVTSDFPSYKGWDLDSEYTDNGGNGFNYARDSFLSYFALAFLGYRGSVRQKYYINNGGAVNFFAAVSRSKAESDSVVVGSMPTTFNGVGNYINSSFDTRLGACVTAPVLNNVIEVETPWYSPYRFNFAKLTRKRNDVGPNTVPFNRHMFTYVGNAAAATMSAVRYVAAGDDFQYIFFKYAPCARPIANPAPANS